MLVILHLIEISFKNVHNSRTPFVGSYFSAAEHFESYYKLSADHKDWRLADGESSFLMDACVNLWRIYTTIGHDLSETDDSEKSIEYLKKALEKSHESKELQF